MPGDVARQAAGLAAVHGKNRSDPPGGTSPASAAVDSVLDVARLASFAPMPACGAERRGTGHFAGVASVDRKDRPVEAAGALPTLAAIARIQEPSRAELSAHDAGPGEDRQENEQGPTRAAKRSTESATRAESMTTVHEDDLPERVVCHSLGGSTRQCCAWRCVRLPNPEATSANIAVWSARGSRQIALATND